MGAIAAREDVRDLILEATDRLLARYGYRKLTMEDLAREVGVAKGTIYLHFAGKEEVVLSHIDRIVERVTAALREIASRPTTHEARVRQMLVARVLVRFDSVQHYTESLDDVLAAIRPSLLERRKRYFEEEATILAAVLRDGVAAGRFSVHDPAEMARTLVLATNALLPYSLSRPELGKRRDLEQRATRLADLLLNGLASRAKQRRVACLSTSRSATS